MRKMNRCYCTSKTRKSESNSQLHLTRAEQSNSCYCTSKTRKSESNSQHALLRNVRAVGCYCTSKTRKSESNSQLIIHTIRLHLVVIALVKLENLKAIHNKGGKT